jgi:hypothetical protein
MRIAGEKHFMLPAPELLFATCYHTTLLCAFAALKKRVSRLSTVLWNRPLHGCRLHLMEEAYHLSPSFGRTVLNRLSSESQTALFASRGH